MFKNLEHTTTWNFDLVLEKMPKRIKVPMEETEWSQDLIFTFYVNLLSPLRSKDVSNQEMLRIQQTMTEAAFFTIGRSRTIGYGKIRPLADYGSRSRLLFFFLKFQIFILFVDSSFLLNSFNFF